MRDTWKPLICLALTSMISFVPVLAETPASLDEQTAIQVEALSRLKGVDLEANATVKAAVLKVLEKTKGTPQFVDLVRDFDLKGQGQALLEYALRFPKDNSGVEAFRMAVAELGRPVAEALLQSKDAPTVIDLIGNSNDMELQNVLHGLITDSSRPSAIRKEALRALAKSQEGANFLLDVAKDGNLPADLTLDAASELNFAPWPEVKKRAAVLVPLPQTQNAEVLPPIKELVKRQGDPKRGAAVFASPTVGCAMCHQINGKGMDFGPNLSEIGTKLGKDALYESILDPGAGIAFGYEAWTVELKNGDEAFGLLASETADEVAVKTQNGITTKYKKDEIANRRKLSTSIMPSGLQMTMTTQELVDLVEYLSTLKKQK